MRKLLCLNGVFAGLASWAILMHWPLVGPPVVSVKALTPSAVENEAKYEYAVRDAQHILAAYDCGDDYSDVIARHALATGLPSRLVAADIAIESSCRADAISPAHAIGLLQVNSHIWKTNEDLRNPETNIRIGTEILAAQIQKYGKRNGLRHYFGITEGSTKSNEYADRVLYASRR